MSYTDDNWYNNGDGGYNDGWSYRNDGVDVEKNTNSNGYPYNVGWTETGEWPFSGLSPTHIVGVSI